MINDRCSGVEKTNSNAASCSRSLRSKSSSRWLPPSVILDPLWFSL